jgi:glycosyltransferase involved in cell wall biosynthesis
MRILLVAAYFPPLNIIAGHRIYSFKKYLEEKGCIVDVITRFYDERDRSGKSLLVGGHPVTELKTPYEKIGNVVYTNFSLENSRKKIFDKLPPGIKGLYNHIAFDVFMWGWYEAAMKAYEEVFSSNQYDFVIGSYGPTTAVQIATRIAKLNNSILIADVRDLYVQTGYSAMLLAIKKFNQYRLLRKAAALLFVSEGMKDYFEKHAILGLKRKKSVIIYNGIETSRLDGDEYDPRDEAVVAEFRRIKSGHDIVLIHSGSVYSDKNLDFFISAAEKIKNIRVAIVIVGMPENNYKQKLSDKCFVLGRVSYETSNFLIKQAHAILQPNRSSSYSGLSGKVFESLYSENFIITDKIVHNDLKSFKSKFSNIKECVTDDEFVQCIHNIHSGVFKKSEVQNKSLLTREYWAGVLFDNLVEIKKHSKQAGVGGS